jgi:hypothetical protein
MALSMKMFETLTLVQTRTIKPVPVVLVGERYWRESFNERKLIIFCCYSSYRRSRSDLKLVRIVIGFDTRKAGMSS